MKQELYKQESDKTRYWSIETKGNSYIIMHGTIEGKLQMKTTFCQAKNIGKKNETTPEEQALKEAEAKIIKQKKKGYVESITGKSNVLTPMLITKFEDREKYLTYPCYECQKYDGLNSTFLLKGDELTVLSRGGETYPTPKHIAKDMIELMKLFGFNRLSVELYDYNQPLNKIVSNVRVPKKESIGLKAIIFDTQRKNIKIGERLEELNEVKNYLRDKNITTIEVADCQKIENREQLDKRYQEHLEKGMEGSVIYLSSNIYEHNKRSLTVFKRKPLKDDEFKIVGFKLDKDNKLPILELETPQQVRFFCKIKGSYIEQISLLKELPEKIGQYFKVQYEKLSEKNKVPLKPVGIGFREMKDNQVLI